MKGSERITFYEAELLNNKSFDAAIANANIVFHCASPYVLKVEDPQKQLVEPAVNGTLNVLRSCMDSKTVSRVVLTSSMAAVTDSPEGTLNEDSWNTKSSLTRNPYYFSKTRAELAAWKFVSTEKPKWDLVVMNPFVIMGPAFDNALNESNKIVLDILTGKYPVIMGLDWGIVDVRDVARAHILAAETSNAKGRYILVDHKISMKDFCEKITRNHSNDSKKVPTSNLDCGIGNTLMKGAALFQPHGVSDYLQTNIGKVLTFDNSKIKKDLGMQFTQLDVTLADTIQSLKDRGHFIPEKK